MAVDPNTDTIEMKALFPNPDSELLPGAYVRVVFDKAVRDNVFAIPRDAVIRTAQGASVFVVGPDGVLETRPVRADTLERRSGMAGFRRPPGRGQGCRQPYDVPPPRHESPQCRRPFRNPMPSNKPPCLISSYAVPFFAWVVALLISLMGLLAIPSLPIAQYPDIAPPVITLRTTYPGASAQDTEEAVTAVIEKEINGAPGLMYMSATSSSDGAVEIAATFQQGTDPDIAAVEVQNRLKIVESRLPEAVRKEGVFVEKSSNNIQAMISLSSTGSLNDTELGEWASARIIPELKRVKGVGRVELFGAETSMRIWPDPEKLEALAPDPHGYCQCRGCPERAHHHRGHRGGPVQFPNPPPSTPAWWRRTLSVRRRNSPPLR